MPRMFHPDLGVDIPVDDDRQAAVLAEAGWEPAPEPEVRPGYAPEPVRYAPVTEPAQTPKKRGAKTEPVEGEDTRK